MAKVGADQDLLFGVLALQMDFISREALIAAVSAWVLDKGRPLAEILVEQRGLAPEHRALLEPLIRAHLKAHGDDAARSLASVSSIGSVKADLEKIGDADVEKSLTLIATARGSDGDLPVPSTVRPPSVGLPTSSGSRFRILRPHARGGLGEVFVARDEELNREVALKEMQEEQADRPDRRARFEQEAEITGALEHPGIVPVYGLGHYPDGRPFYAMRFVKGDSLREAILRFHRAKSAFIARGERLLQLRKLLGRFVDVCNAISYAHSRGVLHRDLKPDNILLGPYGETLVVDWGLAKPVGRPSDDSGGAERPVQPASGSLADQTLPGSVVGTPPFMSPEQAEGRLDRLGPTSDVYSLGATLYVLLTGRLPFEDRDVGTVLRKVRAGEFPAPRKVNPAVHPALEAICLRAMATDPANRYISPRTLAEDVERWLADEPVSAWKEPWTVMARRWVTRHRTAVAAGSAAAFVLAIVGALLWNQALVRAARTRAQGEALARSVATAQVSKVPMIIDQMTPSLRYWADPVLRDIIARSSPESPERLHAALALLPIDSSHVDYLRGRAMDADADTLGVIREALKEHQTKIIPSLWEVARDKTPNTSTRRFRAACMLAEYAPKDPRWLETSGEIADLLLAQNPLVVGSWAELFKPVRVPLLEPLKAIFRSREYDTARPPAELAQAASLMDRFGEGQPEAMIDVIADADPERFEKYVEALNPPRGRTIDALRAVLDESADVPKLGRSLDRMNLRDLLAKRQARAAIALARLGSDEALWSSLRHTADPSRRSYLVHMLPSFGIARQSVVRRFDAETDISARRGLILALGEYTDWTDSERQPIIAKLSVLYRDDPDAGLHSASEWLLRQWRRGQALRQTIETLSYQGVKPRRGWYVNREGQTLAIFSAPQTFMMGSPEDEPGRRADREPLGKARINHTFAIATKEVTEAQFQKFVDAKKVPHTVPPNFSGGPDGPAIYLSWFMAAAYCRWLSEQERIPEDQMCYPTIEQMQSGGVQFLDTPQTRTGYRLPSEREWEFACRAGAETPWFHGTSPSLLPHYAWFAANSGDRAKEAGLLKPNDFGLFDPLGNAAEWCHDPLAASVPGRTVRGGAFSYPSPQQVRCAQRESYLPVLINSALGFRVARTLL